MKSRPQSFKLLIPAILLCSVSLASAGEVGHSIKQKVSGMFAEAGCDYPPRHITLLAIKDEKKIEVWDTDADAGPRLVKEYEIFAASGNTGPKLVRGDYQVPEGVYSIVGLNPNSRYHLSMKLDYPNSFDRKMARCDGRSCLGGDIFIHGSSKSAGCLAVGDAAIEELYQIVSDAGMGRVRVVIAPHDFRKDDSASEFGVSPAWVPELYKNIQAEMATYRRAVSVENIQVSQIR